MRFHGILLHRAASSHAEVGFLNRICLKERELLIGQTRKTEGEREGQRDSERKREGERLGLLYHVLALCRVVSTLLSSFAGAVSLGSLVPFFPLQERVHRRAGEGGNRSTKPAEGKRKRVRERERERENE